jgi:hypothetical protein
MDQIEAVRVLCKLGVSTWAHVDALKCGSEHEPQRVRKVLELAEIAFPNRLHDNREILTS